MPEEAKTMLIVFGAIVIALTLLESYIKGQKQKKKQQAKDKKEEAKIQRAVQKALEEDRKKR